MSFDLRSCRGLCTSAGRLAAVLLLLLALMPACSDDTGDADGAVADAGADAALPDTGSDDADAGPIAEDASDPKDARQPRDTNDNWDWDVGDEDADPAPFRLQEIVPPSGPVEGGNRVRLVGTGFDPGVRVFFGSREVAVDVTAEQMTGRAPAASGPGPVTVKAIAPDGQVETLVDGYEYVEGLSVASVSPARVPTDGGVEVEVRGSGFTAQSAVSFSGEPALRVRLVDAGLLRVVVPPRRRGFADVRVTTRTESEVLERGVEYFDALAVERVLPAAGETSGGQLVTVTGRGFTSQTTFSFGGQPAETVSVDPQTSTAQVRTPAHPAGLVDVAAQSPSDSAIHADAFYYRADASPELAALSPAYGPESGGTEVLLRGWGFDASNLAVTFDGSPATIVGSGPSYALVRTPAGSAGPADVAMLAGTTELDRLSDAFEYRADVWIDAVSPSEGPTDGGTSVTLTGSGFSGADQVLFGGIAASFQVDSDGQITAESPAHGAGAVDVEVVRDGIRAVFQDGFVYTEPLEVWGFDPIRGAVAGNTYVEVRGRGFYGELKVLFDGEEAPVVQRIDRNNLLLYTPPHPVGEADVQVEADGRRAAAPYPYEYFNPASRFGGASGDEVDGAVNVSVFSRGGGPVPGAFVMLSTRDDTRYQGITDANGQVTLSGPDVRGPQTITATAAGYSTATVDTVDAENVTVFLTYLNADPSGGGGGQEGPPYGIIRGDVTTEGKLSDPDNQNTYDMAMVATTQTGVYSRRIDPGPGGTIIGSGAYEIRSRVGDLAVIALCGVYNESTETFDPQFMAVERYLFVSDQGEYDVDLLCNIPLDRSADVKLVNPIYSPQGPDNNRVQVYWDFGFEGIFASPSIGRGLSNLLSVPRQPALDPALDGMTYTFVGGSYTGTYSPSTQTQLSGVQDISQTVVMPPLLDVPEPVSPAIGGLVDNNTITFEASGPFYPDFYSVQFLNSDGLPVWQFIIPGDSNTIRLPDFPDFSFLPEEQRPEPLSAGRIYMTIIGIRASEDFNYESFSYQDLSFDAWRAYSLTRWSFLTP